MGLLVDGVPLSWHDSQPYRAKVKRDGITQFLNVYKSMKDTVTADLKWGDEVEYMLISLDEAKRTARLPLSAPDLLAVLQREEHSQPPGSTVPVLWRPEYANWMIEGTPGVPYRAFAADLVLVEQNMALRRKAVESLLRKDECALTLTAFPRQGCPQFTVPESTPGGPFARSLYTSDDVINPHPRFGTLTRNIRTRRGRKVDILVPLYQDRYTKLDQPLLFDDSAYRSALSKSSIAQSSPANTVPQNHHQRSQTSDVIETTSDTPDTPSEDQITDTAYMTYKEALQATSGKNIVMDSAAFGMGCCCLQVTLQGSDISESRYLYDQLAVMAPIMLSLTAATPAFRGLLADTDARWDVIAAAMDDRTADERETGRIPKSRYSSIDCFISDRAKAKAAQYNDLPVPIDETTYARLVAEGIDPLLAQHVAHLYIREPLVIYGDHVDQDNEKSTDHFENIQSTNWNTVRFKPPPPGTGIGWRTEFRSMEVGLTDFENAAFSVFVVLLSRVILAFDLNLYVPMSRVDENMRTAHQRNSAVDALFHFRKNIFSASSASGFVCAAGHIHHASIVGSKANVNDISAFCPDHSDSESDGETDVIESFTLNEIFNGKPLCHDGKQAGYAFPGLIPLIRGYIESINLDDSTLSRLNTYLDFVGDRAAGRVCTTATFIRNTILRHPAYRHDSVVSEEICHDLVKLCRDITSGASGAAELLGRFHLERYGGVDSSEAMMERMKKAPVGKQAGTLPGSSLPHSALHRTLSAIAMSQATNACSGC